MLEKRRQTKSFLLFSNNFVYLEMPPLHPTTLLGDTGGRVYKGWENADAGVGISLKRGDSEI